VQPRAAYMTLARDFLQPRTDPRPAQAHHAHAARRTLGSAFSGLAKPWQSFTTRMS
jgi:hypothetical protein